MHLYFKQRAFASLRGFHSRVITPRIISYCRSL
jgi:hypothetical protein